MASSLTIKESLKGKYSTCKTSAGVNPASIFQRNPFQNFFHSIFFPGKSLVKNSKLTFNFTWKSPIKNFLHFLQGNLFIIFPKNYFWDHFSKTLSKRVFLKILKNFSNLSKISNPQENCCALFYTNVVVTHNPPFNIS